MSLIPDAKAAKIAFLKNKVDLWKLNAVALGFTVADVTALEAKIAAAEGAMLTQGEAADAHKNATLASDQTITAMDKAGADLISTIRNKARTAGDVIYTLSGIPAPATPTNVGAPGTPFEIKAALKGTGALELTFKCKNPKGCHNVLYHVYRQNGETGEFEFLGGTGEKLFIDSTVPSGVPSVKYQIQGCRSTNVGDVANFEVLFGVNPGSGAMTAKVAKPAKIAA